MLLHRGEQLVPGASATARRLIIDVFIALTAVTILILAVPQLHFSFHWPQGREPVAITGAVISLLTSMLAYLWYSVTGSRSTLFVAVAFLVLAASSFAIGVAVDPNQTAVGAQERVYLWTSGRLVAGTLLLMGAWYRRRDDRPPRHPLLVFLAAAAGAAGVLALLDLGVWFDRVHLPQLCCVGTGHLLSDGVSQGVTPTAAIVATLGAGLYLSAAWLYRADPRHDHYPRGDWLALALVLAAFSHIHYLLAPTVFSDRIATGDLLRIAQFGVLFVGLLWEVRLLLEQERDRTAQLAAMGQMKDDVNRIVTHDLIHSIATLRTFAAHLDERWDDLGEEQRRGAMSRVRQQAKQLGALAQDAAAALNSAQHGIELNPRPEPIVALVREAAYSVDDLEGRLVVRIDDDACEPVALIDHDAMLRVLLNLLWNAEEHSPAHGPVEVSVTADGDEVIVTVVNDRLGAPDAIAERNGTRVASASRVGWGVGLRRSRAVVEAHGGRLWAGIEPSASASYSVGLPRVAETGA